MILVTAAPVVVVVDEEPPRLDGPPPPETTSLSWRWTTATGTEWELTNWASPIIKLKGATGVGTTNPDHWWQDSPTLDGSAWDGLRIGRGSVFLPLMIRGDSSSEFMKTHAEFIRALNPRDESVIRVTRPDATWREQVLRYESGADLVMDLDPVKARRARYGITWATADPFWRGEPVVESFPYYSGGNFFPGPPWNLAPGQILGEGSVDNVGDVDAYPLWHIDGPFTGFTVGVGAATVAATLTKNVGEWVEIDMRPNMLTVVDESGTDRWSALGDANFSSIPPGPNGLDTTLIGAGAGSNVTLSFTPRYWSAL